MYTKKVIQHFTNPHNYGKIEKADAIGEAGNPICGDLMKIYIKVNKNIIENIKFETLGCVAAIATSSMITDLAKEKTLDEAMKISNKDIAKSLEGLPPIKMHCSNLAADALHDAIEKYQKTIKS
ncbi:iron-sulfur cluster assembly scaffold protein [Candidatus Parcubacteria bacterium]|nr:iron-sulfur cluster assembly scaffold protein [Candidatus Parcubacteria bacterium]